MNHSSYLSLHPHSTFTSKLFPSQRIMIDKFMGSAHGICWQGKPYKAAEGYTLYRCLTGDGLASHPVRSSNNHSHLLWRRPYHQCNYSSQCLETTVFSLSNFRTSCIYFYFFDKATLKWVDCTNEFYRILHTT